ncbi:MAG: PAS domain S-box protein [Saprospiraceae bacterium]|nr:PAS domain S-box protein [Saprospiraceae bacterium]
MDRLTTNKSQHILIIDQKTQNLIFSSHSILLGYSIQHFPSIQEYFELIHEEDLASVQYAWKTATEEGKKTSVSYRIKTAEGNYIYLYEENLVNQQEKHLHTRPSQIVKSIHQYHLNTIHPDLSNKLAQFSNEASMILNEQGQVTWINNAFTRILGYTPEDILGKQPFTLLAREFSDDNTFDFFQHRVEELGEFSIELLYYPKNGGSIWTELKVYALQATPNVPKHYLVLSLDITRQKKQEIALVFKNQQLESYAKATSHELRSPIVNIRGLLDLYQLKAHRHDENKELLEDLKACTEQLDETVCTLNKMLRSSDLLSVDTTVYTYPIKNILVIDDDLLFSKIVVRTINNFDQSILVEHQSSVSKALDYLQEHVPDLIFLDLNMPILSGWDFLRLTQGTLSLDCKICILSSSIDPQDRKRSLNFKHVQAFISKPLTLDKLQHLIQPNSNRM